MINCEKLDDNGLVNMKKANEVNEGEGNGSHEQIVQMDESVLCSSL